MKHPYFPPFRSILHFLILKRFYASFSRSICTRSSTCVLYVNPNLREWSSSFGNHDFLSPFYIHPRKNRNMFRLLKCVHTHRGGQPASRRHRHRRRRCRLRAHDVNNRLLINCLTAQVELTMANLWFVTPPGGKPALLRGGCAGIAGVAACGSWRYVHRGVEGWNRGQRRRLGGWMGERGWCARMEEDERRTVVEDERRWRAGHPLST